MRRVEIGNELALTLIAGPCALESADIALTIADELARIGERLKHRCRLQGVLRQGEPHQRRSGARRRA